MKKAFQISLAGTLFSIEEDAYAKLDAYLQSVRRHFASTEGSDEIVRDIEARIAEQLLEAKRQVISMAEVEAVIDSMGGVDDFGDREGERAAETGRPRRLYRNGDDAMLGGVCSGLGSYLGVDALWIRIGFVILALATGFGVLAYLLLWILVPEAKTAAQKLEMAGEPINLETLSESVREKVGEVRKRHGGKAGEAVRKAWAAVRKALNAVASAVVPVLRVTIAVAVAAGAFAGLIAASFFAAVAITNSSSPYLFDFPVTEAVSSGAFYAMVIGGYLVIALPLVALFFLSASLLRKKSAISAELGLGLLVTWCVALVATGVSAFNSAPRIETYVAARRSIVTETRPIPLPIEDIAGVSARRGVRLSVVQGESRSLVATGRADDLDRLQAGLSATVEDDQLVLSREFAARSCVFCLFSTDIEATLTIPDADSFMAEDGSSLTINGWSDSGSVGVSSSRGSVIVASVTAPEISISAEYGATAAVSGSFSTTTVEASTGSSVTLSGSSGFASLSAELGANIDASGMAIASSTAAARQGAVVSFGETDLVERIEEFGGSVRVK